MKKHIIRITVLALVFAAGQGCSGIFDDLAINPGQPSMTSYFTTPEAANEAVLTLYGYISTQRCLGASGSKTQIIRSDEASSNADYGKPGMYGADLNSSYYVIQQPYALMYTTASQASYIIETLPEVDFTDQALKDAYMGEAYFWRAFAHYYLLVNYRNISPIRHMPRDASDYVRPLEAPADVWDFIFEDLENAKTYLPIKGYWNAANNGRVTKAAAAAMLGKCYMYRTGIETLFGSDNTTYYSQAATELGEIIKGTYGTYDLVSDYSWNFDVEHEYNNEAILEVQFLGDVLNTVFNPGQANSGLAFDGRGLMLPGSGVGYEGVAHNWLYDAFAASLDKDGKTDIRMFSTLFFDDTASDIKLRTGQRLTGPGGYKFEEFYPAKDFSSVGNTRTHAYKAAIKKGLDNAMPMRNNSPTNLAGVGAGTQEMIYNQPRAHGVNWRYIRYADVLLLYAEAVTMGGAQNGLTAAEAFNKVRTRANMATKASITLADIKAERVLELALEGHRFYDLLRWGELSSRFKSLETSDPGFKKLISDTDFEGFTDNKHEWLPIPIVEMEANPYITHNNPGY